MKEQTVSMDFVADTEDVARMLLRQVPCRAKRQSRALVSDNVNINSVSQCRESLDNHQGRTNDDTRWRNFKSSSADMIYVRLFKLNENNKNGCKYLHK